MKRILPFLLIALAALISKHSVGQACLTVCPEKISVISVCDAPNWWKFRVGIINPTNGTKSIRIWEEGGSYDTTFDYTGHKDEYRIVTSKPFYSTNNPPKLHWKTFTGSMGHGTTCDGDLLPVRFKSVTAKKDGNSVVVSCDVALENFVGPLTLEHSYDGRDFTTIMTFETNDQQSLYTYRDYPERDKKYVYYRAKGEGKYSAITNVSFAGEVNPQHVYNGQSLSLYYIPAGSTIKIFSPAGQILISTVATSTNQTVPFTNHPKGVYMFVVEDKSQKMYEGKFLVQ